jgi:hypothetical protein
MGLVLDLVAGLAATVAMYAVPYLALRDTSGWSLYAYWVLVSVAYAAYVLYRVSKGMRSRG